MRARIVIACVASALSACGARPPTIEEPKHVVLISIDTLRVDSTSLHGYGLATTPNLENLAQDSVVYERAVHSGGATLAVHMSMITSLLPATHSVRTDRALAEERRTLAEELRQSGFRTAAFVGVPFLLEPIGFTQGFQRVHRNRGGIEATVPEVLAWIEEGLPERSFVFLHIYDLHSNGRGQPYGCGDPSRLPFEVADAPEPPWSLGGKEATQLLVELNRRLDADPEFPVSDVIGADGLERMKSWYDGCVAHVDEQIGRFLAGLEGFGIYDEALVVITSDHGEEFLDHGRLLHGNLPYDELARVILLFKLPRSVRGGTRIDGLASTVDIMPTILDALGAPAPPESEGQSLLGVLSGVEPPGRWRTIWGSVTTRRWKYIHSKHQLHDLLADPRERTNLSAQHAPLARRLRQLGEGAVERSRRLGEELKQGLTPTRVELPEEDAKLLRSLGYLD